MFILFLGVTMMDVLVIEFCNQFMNDIPVLNLNDKNQFQFFDRMVSL